MLSVDERSRYQLAADRAKCDLAEWIRRSCDVQARLGRDE